ncbi:MAG: DNA polymerase III subunit delta' [Xanthomonadaceae bacterium]|nr:DNA polymerase III subunit delta' [Xanthomonadaceae bacterium]
MGASLTSWQQHTFDRAQTAFEAGHLGHGLLFCGPSGIGKRRVAEQLAEHVLCAGSTDKAERERVRNFLAAGTHPDLHRISFVPTKEGNKLRTEIVIEQIRDLTRRLALTPQYGQAQVAIIDPADAINTAACNALLKTLEEPVAGRYLWLLTARPARLPATVRSRCQRLEFKLPSYEKALQWLTGARGYDDAIAKEVLDAAHGHPGMADEWLNGSGWSLRRDVINDLIALAKPGADVIVVAQRWSGDEYAPERLNYAADWVSSQAVMDDLTNPVRLRSLTDWFAAANRMRNLLRTTVRADLAMVELLSIWHKSELSKGET